MNKNILVIAGKKQSGKSSSAKFIYGYEMLRAGVIDRFNLNEEGELFVPSEFVNSEGKVEKQYGILDIDRRDYNFTRYAEACIWPHVKVFNFAKYLKLIAITVFGLTEEQCYGTNAQKETPTTIKWRNLEQFLTNKEITALKKDDKWDTFLTGRQFLQEFGNRICRAIHDGCWIDATFRDIENDQSNINIIGDLRYKNEFRAAQNFGAKTVRLKLDRGDGDTHASETDLDDVPDSEFDFVIDNSQMNIYQKNDEILKVLLTLGWVPNILADRT